MSDSARRRWWGALVVVALLGLGGYGVAVKARSAPPKPATGAAARAVTVVAAPAIARDVGIYLTWLGSVTPLASGTIHSRVDGQLMTVRFQEGQLVKTGDLLAEIDPRPFEAQLVRFEGQLARDQALLDNARFDLEPYRTLVVDDAVPKQPLDTQVSLVRQYEGAADANGLSVALTTDQYRARTISYLNVITTQMIALASGWNAAELPTAKAVTERTTP